MFLLIKTHLSRVLARNNLLEKVLKQARISCHNLPSSDCLGLTIIELDNSVDKEVLDVSIQALHTLLDQSNE